MTISSVNNNLYAVLQQSYLTAAQNVSATPNAKPVPVDPKSYEGTWTGQYGNGTKIRMAISSVSGFKANVRYSSGSTTVQQQVQIVNSSFRIGDSKFILAGTGQAGLATAVTDPLTGNVSLQPASLTLVGSSADTSSSSSSGKLA